MRSRSWKTWDGKRNRVHEDSFICRNKAVVDVPFSNPGRSWYGTVSNGQLEGKTTYMELELTLWFAPLFHWRWGSWLFPQSTRIIQKSSPRKLFFQLVLLFISSSSSPFLYFSSLKSGLVVPKEADMKWTNAWVSTVFCCTPQTDDTIHCRRWNNATLKADFNKLIISPLFMQPRMPVARTLCRGWRGC